MKHTRRHALTAAVAIAATCAAGPVWSEVYPNKLIKLIVAYPAGGDTDAVARLYAEKLSARVGQTVVVENKPGASGVIGSNFVARAEPDGYTLLLAPSTFSIAQLVLKVGPNSGYDVLNDFTPIIQLSTQPMFLVAGKGADGMKSLKDVVAAAKGGKALDYASPGSGSPMHILGEMFNQSAGIKLRQVPYKGVAPALNDVLGGFVPLTYITLGPVTPHLADGKMVLLGVADKKRSPLAPDVPTMLEQGYKDVEVTAWQGLFAPRGLPADIVKKLNSEFNEILKMPDVVEQMKVLGMLPLGGPPETLRDTNAADFERFSKVVKELGIKAN